MTFNPDTVEICPFWILLLFCFCRIGGWTCISGVARASTGPSHVFFSNLNSCFKIPSLKLTVRLWKLAIPAGRFIFQPLICRAYVSFREGRLSFFKIRFAFWTYPSDAIDLGKKTQEPLECRGSVDSSASVPCDSVSLRDFVARWFPSSCSVFQHVEALRFEYFPQFLSLESWTRI